jgi:hypothetical protein
MLERTDLADIPLLEKDIQMQNIPEKLQQALLKGQKLDEEAVWKYFNDE